MIRELLNTLGNPEVFFSEPQIIYKQGRDEVVSEEQFQIMLDSSTKAEHAGRKQEFRCALVRIRGILMLGNLSYGQIRDFINAVADELNEPQIY